ncbi:MAG: hypothetical protein HY908_14820 [Myxococcales bacterium]|nr:hypothetical protein [Myxococcales bacterium]
MHPGARWLAWLGALVVVVACARPARAQPGFTERCQAALPREQIDELALALGAVEGACRLERIDTATYRTVVAWSAGELRVVVLLGPRGCVLEPSHEGTELAFHAPDELGERCPEALLATRRFVGEPREVVSIPDGAGADGSDGPATPLGDPLLAAGLAWLAALGLGVLETRRLLRAARPPALGSWLAVAAGTFAVGLVARWLVEPAPANWYGAFLPTDGWGERRFGSGAAVLQAAVRTFAPATPEVGFGLFRVVGALAVPLGVVLVRRLGGSLAAGTLAGILLALGPIPVRLSASSSEHVVCATLALAAWVTWLGTASSPSAVPRVLAGVLCWLAALTRIDCVPQLALIPLWTLLGAPGRGGAWLPLGRRLRDAGWLVAGLLGIALHGWLTIVRPSHHPGPELAGIRRTLGVLFEQFWLAAREPPHWLTPTCFTLVVLGSFALFVLRRWRTLAALLASLVLVFVPLGRNLSHDGLAGARYFVLLVPLLAIVSGAAVELVERSVPARHRRRVAVVGLAGIAALEGVTAQPGWRHESTFQAEHRFLARALRAHAPELDGCTLWFVRPRQTTGEADLDCCLWPASSPLALVAPGLALRPMPLDRDPDDGAGCHLYYEGSVCNLDPARIGHSPRALARIDDQCERLRQRAGERQLADEEVTDVTLGPSFRGRPWLRLTARGLGPGHGAQ